MKIKLSNSQLKKLKSAIKNESEFLDDNETNFLRKLILTNEQDANLCKAFANYLSADITLTKTQLSKLVQ